MPDTLTGKPTIKASYTSDTGTSPTYVFETAADALDWLQQLLDARDTDEGWRTRLSFHLSIEC